MPIFYVILHTDVYKKHKEMLEIRTITVNPIEENCYILYDKNRGNSCWVVDCGAFFPQEKAEILDFLVREGLKPVRHLLTHSHFDHILGAQFLYEHHKLAPDMLADETETYQKAPAILKQLIPQGMELQIPPHGELLHDEQTLQLEGYTFQVIATPGHTRGGCCYYCAEAGILLTGDTLFRGSYGRTDLPGGDIRQMQQSLLRLMELPDDTIVYPGHGHPTTIGQESTPY